MTTETPDWFRSSYSGNGGQCVEVAVNLVSSRGLVPVRDSKNPNGPALMLSGGAFAGLVEFAKRADV